MNAFQKAYTPDDQFYAMRKELWGKWVLNDPEVRLCFPQGTAPEAYQAIDQHLRFAFSRPTYRNDLYQVTIFDDGGEIIHLSIKRNDRGTIRDWRDLQEIKNQLVGPENEAIEIYPAESRRVDTANQYHLWVYKDPKYRIPTGFQIRLVSEGVLGMSKQRPFEESVKK